MAALFGTGLIAADFRIALAGTFVPIDFLTSDALNSVYVPLHKHLAINSNEDVPLFVWTTGGVFLIVALIIGSALWLSGDIWAHVLAPGVNDAVIALAGSMLRIMSAGAVLFLLSTFLVFVSMANEDFLPISVRSTLQNIGVMGGIGAAFLFSNPRLLAWGFTISYLAFFIWTLRRAIRAGFLRLPKTFSNEPMKRLLGQFWKRLRPLVLLPFFLQGNIVVERIVASFLGVSAISALDYARFVGSSMIALVAVPVSYAGLAHWSALSLSDMRERLPKVILFVLVAAIPICTFFLANASFVVNILYARGAFNATSIRVTSSILTGLSYGLWAQVLGYILMKGLSAQGKNDTVLRIMVVSLCANALFDIFLYRKLGALTLGLGNSVFGFGLMIGTLTAFKLWRDFFKQSKAMLFGGVMYLIVVALFPIRAHMAWRQIAEVVIIAIVFWITWFLVNRQLRLFVSKTVFGFGK